MKEDLSDTKRWKLDNDVSDSTDGQADGMYLIPIDSTTHLQVMASELFHWDRLSIFAVEKRRRRKKPLTREPSLKEIRHVQRMFFDDNERVFINTKPEPDSKYAMLVRPQEFIIPLPGEPLPEPGTTLAASTSEENEEKRRRLEELFGAPENAGGAQGCGGAE